MLANNVPLKKNAYFWKAAPAKTNQLHKIALGIGILCLLLIFLAASHVVNGPFTDIPILSMVVGEDEMNDMAEEAQHVLDKLEEAIEDDNDDLIDELEEEYNLPIKELQDAFDPLSLSSVRAVGHSLGESDMYGLFDAVIAFVIGYAVIIALLTLLAVLLNNTALAVVAYMISLPFHIFLSGMLFLILSTVAFIGLTQLLKKLNGEYKAYKLSFAN